MHTVLRMEFKIQTVQTDGIPRDPNWHHQTNNNDLHLKGVGGKLNYKISLYDTVSKIEKQIEYFKTSCCSVAQSNPTLQPHGLQHARLPCPSWSEVISM